MGEPTQWKPSARVPLRRVSMVTVWPIRPSASGVSATSAAVTLKVTWLIDIGNVTPAIPERSMVLPCSSSTVPAVPAVAALMPALMVSAALGALISAPSLPPALPCTSTLPDAWMVIVGCSTVWKYGALLAPLTLVLELAVDVGSVPLLSSGRIAVRLDDPSTMLPLAVAQALFRQAVLRRIDPVRVVLVVATMAPS